MRARSSVAFERESDEHRGTCRGEHRQPSSSSSSFPTEPSFGFVSVALPFVATHRGISVEAIGGIVALAFAPHGYKFLWAPLVDSTLTRKTWFLTSLVLVAGGSFACLAMPITPGSLASLTAVVVASQIGLTFLAMTCQAFMGTCLAPEEKGRGAGWYQAGAFVGGGAGGGAALFLAQHLEGWQAGGIVAGVMLLCALPLRWVVEPAVVERPTLPNAVRTLGRELKLIVVSRGGRLGLLICLLPVGAGAAQNLFGALALSWNASERVVALATGLLGGVAAAGGAVLGGRLADRLSRRLVFALGGAIIRSVRSRWRSGPGTRRPSSSSRSPTRSRAASVVRRSSASSSRRLGRPPWRRSTPSSPRCST